MDGFLVQLGDDASACETYIKTLLGREEGPATQLRDAMAYAVLNGGKRIRAALVFGAARMASGAHHDAAPSEAMLRTAAAIEFLHAYSLVHDDLPAMDDAATRRGQPSCHIEFDEATAILAGDALQTMAFEILADPQTHSDAPDTPKEASRQLWTLLRASSRQIERSNGNEKNHLWLGSRALSRKQ